jgi:hypothetical protein
VNQISYFNQIGPLISIYQRVCAPVKVLLAGAEGPRLHRPGNWLVRQLNDEPNLEYKVGFIREKGKARAREVNQSPEAGSSLLR